MRKKSNFGSMVFLLLFIGIIVGVVYVSTSSEFEKIPPELSVENNGYWNLKEPLHVNISDTTGIKEYKISMVINDEAFVIEEKELNVPQKEVVLDLKAPKKFYAIKADSIEIIVEATDISKWNLLAGNRAATSTKLIIDKKRPRLSIITNSWAIRKGGSALVVFKVEDSELDSITIETNFDKTFIAQPFYKEGYYASLLAWPITESGFKAVVVAKDKAGNVSKSTIPLRQREKQYRLSKIKLSDKFLDGKVADLAQMYSETDLATPIDKFKFVNEDLRAKNEAVIHQLTSKVSDTKINSLDIKPFYPLKNGQKVASFGDHRLYYYKGEQVSESYHLGLDLASVKMGKILSQNESSVVYSQENGIYGNMPALHHGMGLYTIYGHCSNLLVHDGDKVSKNEHIANTGMSGYAMGDHLHFGVLVQGIEVRPEEWMDKDWIKKFITNVFKDAKKLIDRQK